MAVRASKLDLEAAVEASFLCPAAIGFPTLPGLCAVADFQR